MPGEEHAARRRAIAELTASLNRAAAQMLHNVIPTAEESPHPAGSAEGLPVPEAHGFALVRDADRRDAGAGAACLLVAFEGSSGGLEGG